MFNRVKSFISSWTAFFVLVTQVVLPLPAAQAVTVNVSGEGVASTFQLHVPSDLGTIESLIPGASDKTLVHIQTAHGNYEAQKNIHEMIRFLNDRYGFNTLLIEGSTAKLRPEILRLFPERMDLTMQIAEELTRKALVKGPELFLLENKSAVAYGIEDPESYIQNGEAFKEVLLAQDRSEQFVRDMEMQIERLTGPFLNRELRAFLNRLEDFETKKLPMMEWLTELRKSADKVLDMDLSDATYQMDWPMLVRIFKMTDFERQMNRTKYQTERKAFLNVLKKHTKDQGDLYTQVESVLTDTANHHRLPDPQTGILFEQMVAALPANFDFSEYSNLNLFIGRLILQSEIKGDLLMEELEAMTRKISERLAKTDEEKKLLSLFKDLRLLKQLFALELTPRAYEEILNRGESVVPSEVMNRFYQIDDGKRVKLDELNHMEEVNSLFRSAFEFYRTVKERDGWMLQNAEARMKEAGVDKAIVITGGFHAAPFEKYFAYKDFNYALISPKISTTDGRDSYVESVLHKEKNLFTQTRETAPYFQISTTDIEDHGLTTEDLRYAAGELIETHINVMGQNGEMPTNINGTEFADTFGITTQLVKGPKGPIFQINTTDAVLGAGEFQVQLSRGADRIVTTTTPTFGIDSIAGGFALRSEAREGLAQALVEFMTLNPEGQVYDVKVDDAGNVRLSSPSNNYPRHEISYDAERDVFSLRKIVDSDGTTRSLSFSSTGALYVASEPTIDKQRSKLAANIPYNGLRITSVDDSVEGQVGIKLNTDGFATRLRVEGVLPSFIKLLEPNGDGAGIPASVRSESRELTDAELQALQTSIDTFQLSEANADYVRTMWTQEAGDQLVIRLDGSREIDETGNYLLAIQLTPEERERLMGTLSFEETVNGPKSDDYVAAAKTADVTIYSLDGGLGEKLGRWEYKANLVERGLLSEDDVERYPAGHEREGQVVIGAKGTDLGYIVNKNGQEVFISIAEAKLLQMVKLSRDEAFAGLGITPLVNEQSLPSYVNLFNKTFLEDRLDDSIPANQKRTYRQVLESMGIVINDPFLQQNVPGIEQSEDLPAQTTEGLSQPGGHGQLGFGFFHSPENWTPSADGSVKVLYFNNGDNLNSSRLNPHIIGRMIEERIPMGKVTTVATRIDKKGGKDGVKIVNVDGNMVFVPQQMEIADAQAAGQEDQFVAAGQPDGVSIYGNDSVGKQPFNTNIIPVVEDYLMPLLADLKAHLGAEKYFSDVIAPTRITKDTKEMSDGKEYMPIDGAIGTVIHNINEYIMTATDPAIIAILEKHNITPDDTGARRALKFFDVPRAALFTPNKNPFDTFQQGSVGYFEFDTEDYYLKPTSNDLVPPQISIVDKDGFEFDKGKGRYAELQNLIDTFGENANVKRLASLDIQGDVKLQNATLAGDVAIFNQTGELIDLRSDRYRAALVAAGVLVDDQLILDNVTIDIRDDGRIEIINPKLDPVSPTVKRYLGALKDTHAAQEEIVTSAIAEIAKIKRRLVEIEEERKEDARSLNEILMEAPFASTTEARDIPRIEIIAREVLQEFDMTKNLSSAYRAAFALSVFDEENFPLLHEQLKRFISEIDVDDYAAREIDGDTKARRLKLEEFEKLLALYTQQEAGQTIDHNMLLRFAINEILFAFPKGERRSLERQVQVRELIKDLREPGKGNVPILAFLTDLHGGSKIGSLVARLAGVSGVDYQDIKSPKQLEEVLAAQNKKVTDKNLMVVGMSDYVDRGPRPYRGFTFSKWLRKHRMLKFIEGNHDKWHDENILGIHLRVHDAVREIVEANPDFSELDPHLDRLKEFLTTYKWEEKDNGTELFARRDQALREGLIKLLTELITEDKQSERDKKIAAFANQLIRATESDPIPSSNPGHSLEFWADDWYEHADWAETFLDEINSELINEMLDVVNNQLAKDEDLRANLLALLRRNGGLQVDLGEYESMRPELITRLESGQSLFAEVDPVDFIDDVVKAKKEQNTANKNENAIIRSANENASQEGRYNDMRPSLPTPTTFPYTSANAATKLSQVRGVLELLAGNEPNLNVPAAPELVTPDNYRKNERVLETVMFNLKNIRFNFIDVWGNAYLHGILPVTQDGKRFDVNYKGLRGLLAVERMQYDVRRFFERFDESEGIPDTPEFRRQLWAELGELFQLTADWYSDSVAGMKPDGIKRFIRAGGPRSFAREYALSSAWTEREFGGQIEGEELPTIDVEGQMLHGHVNLEKLIGKDISRLAISQGAETDFSPLAGSIVHVDLELSEGGYAGLGGYWSMFDIDPDTGERMGIRVHGYRESLANAEKRLKKAKKIIATNPEKIEKLQAEVADLEGEALEKTQKELEKAQKELAKAIEEKPILEEMVPRLKKTGDLIEDITFDHLPAKERAALEPYTKGRTLSEYYVVRFLSENIREYRRMQKDMAMKNRPKRFELYAEEEKAAINQLIDFVAEFDDVPEHMLRRFVIPVIPGFDEKVAARREQLRVQTEAGATFLAVDAVVDGVVSDEIRLARNAKSNTTVPENAKHVFRTKANTETVLTVKTGSGTIRVNRKTFEVKKGDRILLPAGRQVTVTSAGNGMRFTTTRSEARGVPRSEIFGEGGVSAAETINAETQISVGDYVMDQRVGRFGLARVDGIDGETVNLMRLAPENETALDPVLNDAIAFNIGRVQLNGAQLAKPATRSEARAASHELVFHKEKGNQTEGDYFVGHGSKDAYVIDGKYLLSVSSTPGTPDTSIPFSTGTWLTLELLPESERDQTSLLEISAAALNNIMQDSLHARNLTLGDETFRVSWPGYPSGRSRDETITLRIEASVPVAVERIEDFRSEARESVVSESQKPFTTFDDEDDELVSLAGLDASLRTLLNRRGIYSVDYLREQYEQNVAGVGSILSDLDRDVQNTIRVALEDAEQINRLDRIEATPAEINRILADIFSRPFIAVANNFTGKVIRLRVSENYENKVVAEFVNTNDVLGIQLVVEDAGVGIEAVTSEFQRIAGARGSVRVVMQDAYLEDLREFYAEAVLGGRTFGSVQIAPEHFEVLKTEDPEALLNLLRISQVINESLKPQSPAFVVTVEDRMTFLKDIRRSLEVKRFLGDAKLAPIVRSVLSDLTSLVKVVETKGAVSYESAVNNYADGVEAGHNVIGLFDQYHAAVSNNQTQIVLSGKALGKNWSAIPYIVERTYKATESKYLGASLLDKLTDIQLKAFDRDGRIHYAVTGIQSLISKLVATRAVEVSA